MVEKSLHPKETNVRKFLVTKKTHLRCTLCFFQIDNRTRLNMCDIKIIRNALLITLVEGGKQNLPPQNMHLWHKDYLELLIFKKLQTQEEL